MTRTPIELFDCERVNAYLESYLLDQVPPPERRGMRMHIHGCPACFRLVTSRDPLQLFAPLADESARPEVWEGFWPAIGDGISREEARRSSRRVWVRAAAVIGMAGAAAMALWLGPRLASPDKAMPEAPTLVAGGSPLPQTVERVRAAGSEEAQVYTMSYSQGTPAAAAGEAAPVAELVLIVDKGLEL